MNREAKKRERERREYTRREPSGPLALSCKSVRRGGAEAHRSATAAGRHGAAYVKEATRRVMSGCCSSVPLSPLHSPPSLSLSFLRPVMHACSCEYLLEIASPSFPSSYSSSSLRSRVFFQPRERELRALRRRFKAPRVLQHTRVAEAKEECDARCALRPVLAYRTHSFLAAAVIQRIIARVILARERGTHLFPRIFFRRVAQRGLYSLHLLFDRMMRNAVVVCACALWCWQKERDDGCEKARGLLRLEKSPLASEREDSVRVFAARVVRA